MNVELCFSDDGFGVFTRAKTDYIQITLDVQISDVVGWWNNYKSGTNFL